MISVPSLKHLFYTLLVHKPQCKASMGADQHMP